MGAFLSFSIIGWRNNPGGKYEYCLNKRPASGRCSFWSSIKILESKNGRIYIRYQKKISIINLEITQSQLNAAASRVESICSRGNKLLFVGTKRSASKAIREKASSLGLPFVDKRWLGGTLTNWKTIRSSIRRLSDLEEMMSSGRIEKLSKKEALEISRASKTNGIYWRY